MTRRSERAKLMAIQKRTIQHWLVADRRWAIQARRAVIGLLGGALVHNYPLLHTADAQPLRVALPPLADGLSSLRGRAHVCRATSAPLPRPHALPLAPALCFRGGARLAAEQPT